MPKVLKDMQLVIKQGIKPVQRNFYNIEGYHTLRNFVNYPSAKDR